MNRQAIVGIFTVVPYRAVRLLLVLANVGRRTLQDGRPLQVRVRTAQGRTRVRERVVVGVIDQTNLLEDFTVEVVMAINNNVSVPRDARFVIQARSP